MSFYTFGDFLWDLDIGRVKFSGNLSFYNGIIDRSSGVFSNKFFNITIHHLQEELRK